MQKPRESGVLLRGPSHAGREDVTVWTLQLGWRSTRISLTEAGQTRSAASRSGLWADGNSEEGEMRVLLTAALIVGFASQTVEAR